MSENDNKPKRRPLKNLPPDRFQPKVWLIWLAIITILILVLKFNPGRMNSPATLKIQEVVDYAATDKIAEGKIRPDPSGGRDWEEITGDLKDALLTSDSGKTKSFHAAGRLTDANMEILQKSKVFTEVSATNFATQVLTQILPFVIVIGLLYFLFVRQLKQAGRGALSFGKSRAKLLTRDRDKVTFAEVAGCDEAKEEVSEVVEFLKDPKRFQKIGGRIPKGVLMVGPPGTGKTLLAKAIAGEAEVPFFSISGSDFVEMFVGVGASRVRDMFEQGRKNAPCLIFIDEIDAVGRQRGAGLGGGNDEREQTLNSLLAEMDGFDTTEGVIIIAATNRPDVLDSALLRPGRFDRQIFIDLPDLVGREQILRVHSRKLAIAEDVDLSVVARGTPGLSGAELANLLNESALLAARRNKKRVDMHDIEDAREKVQFGRERRRIMDDEDKKIVAYHEAGHALVGAVVDDGDLPVHKVTIIPRGRSLGSTMYIPRKDVYNYAKRRMLARLATLFGGRIAEEVVLGDITSGASSDILQATKLARSMVCDWGMSPLGPIAYGENHDTVFLGREISRSENFSEDTARLIDAEIHKLVDEQYSRAKSIIIAKRAALDKIAEALLQYETIEGKHVFEILEFGDIRSPVAPPVIAKAVDLPAGRKPAEKAAPEGLSGDAPAPAPSPA
ncbi:MAG TPA: ATP-dependent zinc metalloprotease FtsH [Opitutaceae bacterium]|jgi:cell division protease FtsH|nr:ATP-dependent zinc metalloprotease FtsH [Opitutaceae bacterium]